MENMDLWLPCYFSFSILINGMPRGFFSTSRGLRQRDPLSPFLFTLVADAFNQLLSRGKKQNLFKGIQVGKEKISIRIYNMPMTLYFSWTVTRIN